MATDTLKNALLNPKKIVEGRMEEAERDPKAGKDAGNLPGEYQMSQSQFSKYPGKPNTKRVIK